MEIFELKGLFIASFIIVFTIILSSCDSQPKNKDPIKKKTNDQNISDKMTPADHLKAANEAIKEEDIITARTQLRFIPKDSKEYKEVPELEKKIDSIERKFRSRPQKEVKLHFDNWRFGGFKSVMIATFTINNQTDNDIKDIQIVFYYKAKSETLLGSSNYTVYDIVRAGKKKTFNKVNVGFIHSQTDQSSAEIIGYDTVR